MGAEIKKIPICENIENDNTNSAKCALRVKNKERFGE